MIYQTFMCIILSQITFSHFNLHNLIQTVNRRNVRPKYRRKLLHEPPTGDKEKQKNNYESDRKRISVFRRECVWSSLIGVLWSAKLILNCYLMRIYFIFIQVSFADCHFFFAQLNSLNICLSCSYADAVTSEYNIWNRIHFNMASIYVNIRRIVFKMNILNNFS